MTTQLKYESICNVKYKAKGHFFDAGTMRFFKSKAYETVYCGKLNWYFVTSEKNDGYKRLFTVRALDLTTLSIETIGEFQLYNTQLQAEKAAKRYAEIDLQGFIEPEKEI